MRLPILLLALASGIAPAHAEPTLPDRLCVPRAVVERWAVYGAGRPWGEVAAIMDDMRALARSPAACPAEPAPAPAAEAPR